MKTVLSSFILGLAVFGTSFAQSDQPHNVVKVNLLSLTEGTFSASFEKTLSEKRSFQINSDYHSERDFTDRYTGIGISAEYRFYGLILNRTKTAPDGFFAGPSAGLRLIRYVDTTDPEFTDRYQVLQVGGVVGYQWLPKSKNGLQRLSVEGSIGLLAGFSFGEDIEGFGDDFGLGSRFNSGIVPALAISAGYIFGRK